MFVNVTEHENVGDTQRRIFSVTLPFVHFKVVNCLLNAIKTPMLSVWCDTQRK